MAVPLRDLLKGLGINLDHPRQLNCPLIKRWWLYFTAKYQDFRQLFNLS